MGHDITTIGRHNFNTVNVQVLAQQLAHRFNANIKFACQDAYAHYFNPGQSSTYNYIPLGEIIIPGATATYNLQDDYYQLKKYYEEHGDALFDLDYVKKQEGIANSIKNELATPYFDFYLNNEEEGHATIHSDTVNIDFFYCSRWWTFCRLFTTENNFDANFEGVNTYRKKLQENIRLWGGSDMVYLDDQGETSYLIYGDYTWQQIQLELATKFKGQVLNVSAFMKCHNPRTKNDYPLAFYDDFTDL